MGAREPQGGCLVGVRVLGVPLLHSLMRLNNKTEEERRQWERENPKVGGCR